METLFPPLVAALEVFDGYCPQHVPYTVNKVIYTDVLKRVIRVRPDNADKWMLHHDNAPCHTSLSVTEFLTSKGIPVVLQPHVHLTSAPVTFPLFLNLKMSSEDVISGLEKNIQNSVTHMLKTSSAAIERGNNVSIGV